MIISATNKGKMVSQKAEPNYERFLYRINYILVHFQCNFYGYPRLSRDNVEDYVESLGAPEDEVKEYIKMTRIDLTWQQRALIVSGILVIIKNFIFPYYVISSIDSLIYESALRQRDTLHYGCLETNCTDPVHVRQFLRTPIFSVCHHWLYQIYPAVTGLQIFGLSLHTIYILYVLIMHICLILVLYFHPSGYESFIFLITPKLDRLIRCEEIRRYLLSIHMSMENYFRGDISYSFPDDTTDEQDPATIVHYSKKEFVSSVALDHEYEQINRLGKRYKDLDASAQAYISDCMTVFREDVWWKTFSRMNCIWSSVLFAFLFISLIGSFFGVDYMIGIVFQETQIVLETLRATGCSVWRDNRSDPISAASLVRTQWRAFPLAEIIVVTLVSGLMVSISITRYHVGICEINSMLAEQMDRIYMTIEITKLLKDMDFGVAQSIPREGLDENLYNFNQLKYLHQRSIKVGAGLTFLNSFKRTSSNYIHSDGPWQVAMDIVGDCGANMYSYANLLMKIYINNRVLERTVRELSMGLEIILLVALILNYGCVGIVIYYNRKFEDSNLLPIIWGFIGILTNSMIIVYPSAVNAFSKRMLNSLWQLVVITLDFQDIRVAHVRSLLLKQIGFFCDNGGLMFTAFGIPITYGTVIKIALWSATLAVVSFSS